MKIENYDCEEEYDKFSEMYDKWVSPTWPNDDNIQGFIDFLERYILQYLSYYYQYFY